ncbi:curli assembly protein CsgF [Roseinatronobacter thiooxidans]|nr:curli assembly protein CsgF [Roseinatronobacter thiooxidans]
MKWDNTMKMIIKVVAVSALIASPVVAQDLVHTPLNPSFGGSPLNSQHLLATANAQRTATASDAPSRDAMDSLARAGRTDADLFLSQLQGRLLSQLASQVTNAIFGGDDPETSGQVIFGDTRIDFSRSLTSIELTIFDGISTTEIVVPQLVIN